MEEKEEGRWQRSCSTGCAGLNICQQGNLLQGLGPTARHRLPLSEATSGEWGLQPASGPDPPACDLVVWLLVGRGTRSCTRSLI